jgi:hypothetical protein
VVVPEIIKLKLESKRNLRSAIDATDFFDITFNLQEKELEMKDIKYEV